MDRGEMRTELIDILEDDNNAFSTDRLDRAIQRAAEYIHTIIVTAGPAVNYARGYASITVSSNSQDISASVTRFDSFRYMRRQGSTGNNALSRDTLLRGVPKDEFARVIPENERGNQNYVTGFDMDGRPVAYLTYDPLTINWVYTHPGGTWDFVWSKTCLSIPANTTGASGDDLDYDTIPAKHHQLVVLRAAKNIQGQHNEIPDINEQYDMLFSVLQRDLRVGTSSGFIEV